MSQEPFSPYGAATQPGPWDTPAATETPYPLFTQIFAGVDLALIAFRMLLVAFAVIGVAVMGEEELGVTMAEAIAEIATGLLIVILALPANILLLMRKRMGVYLAYAAVVATLLNIVTAAWQSIGTFSQSEFANDSEATGFVIGATLAFAFRIAIMIGYGCAAWLAQQWHDQRNASTDVV